MAVLQTGLAKSLAEDYTIDQSLRFDDGDSAYMSRTPTAGNQKTWTWSGWIKRGNLTGAVMTFFSSDDGSSSNRTALSWSANEEWEVAMISGSQTNAVWSTSELARDPSAWYHFVCALDTTESAAADRLKFYINGVRVTNFSLSPAIDLNGDYDMNSAGGKMVVGRRDYATDRYYDGYLAEVYFIDGASLGPDSFAETDDTTNQWKPIEYDGSSVSTYIPGDRTSTVTVSSAGLSLGVSGTIANFVNGNFGEDTTNSWYFSNDYDPVGGHVKFDFGSAVTNTDAKWYQSNSNSHGTWKWQGSNDDSDWTDIGSSFTLGGATMQQQTQLNGNATAYRYYRLLGLSGTTSSSPYIEEIVFADTSLSGYGTNGFYQKYAGTELANSFFDSGNGGRHVVTANGDVHTDTAVKKIGTASAQFDGTGDYLSVPDSTDWNFTASEATIECWVYLNSMPSVSVQLIGQNDGSASNWFVYIYANGKIAVGLKNVNEVASATGVISTDTWYHVAVVRESSDSSAVTRIYVDGVSVANATAQYFNDSSDDLFIGGNSDESGLKYMDGYLDEIRISDVARYQIPFTPSTEAFTNDINTMLLLHCDGSNDGTSFPDSASHPITANGDVANTRAEQKVGDSSIYFDGSGDYLSLADSTDWDFGTGDFTIEGWWWIDSAQTTSRCWSTGAGADGKGFMGVMNTNNGTVDFLGGDGGSWTFNFATPSSSFTNDAWNHVAWVRDGTTVRTYVGGVQKATGTYSGSGVDDDTTGWWIGRWSQDTGNDMLGYLDEYRVSNTCRYPDGTTFTPQTTEFTADANTKLLIHSDWNGGLGADSSGNNNTFTPTNLVATDKMVDSPTNNFSTLNPLNGNLSDGTYFSEGNLESYDGAGWAGSSTIQPESGKWYAEFLVQSTSAGSGANESVVGIVFDSWLEADRGEYPGSQTDQYGYYRSGQKVHNGSFSSYGDAYVAGDIIGVALDLTNDNLYFSKNNAWQNSGDPTSGATGTGALSLVADKQWAFALGTAGGAARTDWNSNFGADSSFAGNETAQGNQDSNGIGDFYYEPPTDFLALCTSNLDAPSIKKPGDNFNTVLYTGDASTRSITGVGFQPDFIWAKSRSDTRDHVASDAVRGVEDNLSPNTTGAADDGATNAITSFDSDGWSMGSDGLWNANTETFVAWNWLGANGTTANTTGTIDSTVSANTTAGFSIITYTGVYPQDPATIGHGLSSAPELVIVKRRNTSGGWWIVGSNEMTSWDYYMGLNEDDAQASGGYFESTAPTASVIELRNDGDSSVNGNGNTYVAYAFHSVEGYSKIGYYNGNYNVDGPFIYTGFKPAFVMVKRISGVNNWVMTDSERSPYNAIYGRLWADLDNAEATDSVDSDFVSNGFKLRVANNASNPSDSPMLYIAFAESPFKYSNAR